MRKHPMEQAQETAATDTGIYLKDLFKVSATETTFQEELSKQTECRVSPVPTIRRLDRDYQLALVSKLILETSTS